MALNAVTREMLAEGRPVWCADASIHDIGIPILSAHFSAIRSMFGDMSTP
jgi:hypothetical protein